MANTLSKANANFVILHARHAKMEIPVMDVLQDYF